MNGLNGDINGGNINGGMPADPIQGAWGLFGLTGGIGYYLLYKELSGQHDETRDKRRD